MLLALALLGMPALVLSSQAATSGFLEICKDADGPGVTGVFSFSVAGQMVEVPVGACSAAIQLPPGTVTVTETARPGTVVTGIQATPSGRLVSGNPAGRTAQVTIVAGDISTQTIVAFANRAEVGQLKICKVAGPGVIAGTQFAFQAGGLPVTVPAGPAPGGFCTVAGTFPVGSAVTVDESVPSGVEVSSVTVAPPDRAGAVNLPAGTAETTIGAGVTEVTFTNRQAPTVAPVPQGFLRICKRAEGPGVVGPFTFTVAGQALDVAANSCSPTLQLPAGTVTVTEAPSPGTVLTGVEASPSSRLVATDLPARSTRVAVVAGDFVTQTLVTFVNRAETGQLKVCKVAGPGVTAGTEFAFRVGAATLTVPAGPGPGGFCVLGGSFPVGTNVAVSETVPPGLEVSAIAVEPPDRAGGPAGLAGATQLATIGSGVTEVTFTNRRLTQGFVRVCKRSDGPGVSGSFTFSVGAQLVDIPVNGCTPLLAVPAGPLMITETARAGSVLSAVDVVPPDRRLATDLAGRSVQVRVVAGDIGTHAVVLFANRAVVAQTTTTVAPPTTTTAPATTTTTNTGVSPTTLVLPTTTAPPATVPPITFPTTTTTTTTAPPPPMTTTTTTTTTTAPPPPMTTTTVVPLVPPTTTTTAVPPTTTTTLPGVPPTTTTTTGLPPTTTTTGVPPTTTTVPGLVTTQPPATTTTVPAGGNLPTSVPLPTTTTVPAGGNLPTTLPPAPTPTAPPGSTPPTTAAPRDTRPTTPAPPTTVPAPAGPTAELAAKPTPTQPSTRVGPQARRGPLSTTGSSLLLPLLAGVLLVLGAATVVSSRGPVLVTASELPVPASKRSRDQHGAGPVTAAPLSLRTDDLYRLPPRASAPRRRAPRPAPRRPMTVRTAPARARDALRAAGPRSRPVRDRHGSGPVPPASS